MTRKVSAWKENKIKDKNKLCSYPVSPSNSRRRFINVLKLRMVRLWADSGAFWRRWFLNPSYLRPPGRATFSIHHLKQDLRCDGQTSGAQHRVSPAHHSPLQSFLFLFLWDYGDVVAPRRIEPQTLTKRLNRSRTKYLYVHIFFCCSTFLFYLFIF